MFEKKKRFSCKKTKILQTYFRSMTISVKKYNVHVFYVTVQKNITEFHLTFHIRPFVDSTFWQNSFNNITVLYTFQ